MRVAEQLPPEFGLVDALLAGDRDAARRIAADLHQSGIDYVMVDEAIRQNPQLEESLWELLREVAPLPRRAVKRRAIRAAEDRDWGDWEAGKKKV